MPAPTTMKSVSPGRAFIRMHSAPKNAPESAFLMLMVTRTKACSFHRNRAILAMGKSIGPMVYAGSGCIRYTRSLTRIPVQTSSRSYEVLVERGLLRSAAGLLQEIIPAHSKAFLVSSGPILKLWGTPLMESFANAGHPLPILEMADGEASKRMRAVEKLAVKMVRLGADRRSMVIALGGGVVGDVAGFVASIY